MKSKTLPQLKRACWTLISEWVRRKDANPDGYARCYSCGIVGHWKDMQAGHFVPGRTGAVLLNLEVIRVQCPQCNIFLHGNLGPFTLRMVDELGRAKVDELLKLRHQVKKWSRSELQALQADLKQKLASLNG